MHWLHLSDIHIGRPGATVQKAALDGLLGAVEAVSTGIQFDAIFITGDLAYRGVTSQYDDFAKNILTPLRRLAAYQDARVIVAPGNHDVDCDVSLPITWENLGSKRQEIFFEETPAGIAMRKPRAVSFSDFSTFLGTNALEGPDPLTEVSKEFSLLSNGEPISVIATNTAIFCDKDIKDREQLPTPDLSLRTILHALPTGRRAIILGHHPSHWFIPQHRNPFKSLLVAHKAIYLHGHTHEIETDFGPEGLISLGFGAAYQGSPLAPPAPYYRNTFALCELDKEALHVAPYHWDGENGRWVATTTLPPGFQHRSAKLANGWRLGLARGAAPPILGAPDVAATQGKQIRLAPIGTLSAHDWSELIVRLRLLAADITASMLTPKTSPAGQYYFEYKLPAGLHYVHCVSGPGTHMHGSQVHDINTRLDTEGYASYTLVSLGTMTEEAATIYQRLRTRKAIEIHTSTDLATRLSGIGEYKASLERVETAISDTEFLVLPGGRTAMLVQSKSQSAWFYVIDETGSRLPESHADVQAVRRHRPDLARSAYRHAEEGQPEPPKQPTFDRQSYLSTCVEEFRAVKYAPLATVGLRMPGVKLEDLYIETGAQAAEEGARLSLSKALSDLLRSSGVDGVVKESITQLFGPAYSSEDAERYEQTSARVLYRSHGSIAVLGDPGSGKTCFVKREIIAYCSDEADSWYSRHLPVFVPLSELAATRADSYDVLAIAASLAGRRGLPISEEQMRKFYSQGELAIFLDGLDEIVSLDKRSRVLAAIKQLIEEGRILGNRFVLTSRPAAIHHTELPKTLHAIRMRGLTDEEMRILAERIVVARLSESETAVRVNLEALTSAEQVSLQKFLDDCQATPGIDRLARNPLFLTLLIMIYMNRGPTSSKRHRVYSQAVTTLVSVRSIEAGQRGISESDLRKRLGAIALAVFKDPHGAFPTYDQVVTSIRQIVEKERDRKVDRDVIEKYVKDVAEATGILVINQGTSSGEAATVTFMHHSFLEYYAALGLAATDYEAELPVLARIPRWRDIITLLAGIVGDTTDSSRIVSSLLSIKDSYESLTHDLLILALDCALEGDAPPERVVLAIVDRINDGITSGTLVYDDWLRAQIGQRLGRMLVASSSPLLHSFLEEGLERSDNELRAAFVDLAGHMAREAELSDRALRRFDALALIDDPKLASAICRALSRSSQLRSESGLACVRRSLGGGVDAAKAALDAVLVAPALGVQVVDLLTRNLDDAGVELAETSAKALMKVGPPSLHQPEGAASLATSLRRIAEGAALNSANELALAYSRETIEPLLSSSEKGDRILGIRLLPWVTHSDQFIHDRLIGILASSEREEKSAALASLRISTAARNLFTVPDTYVVRALLSEVHTRDVRLNAARVLAAYDIDDVDVIRELTNFAKSVAGTEQYPAAVRILGPFANNFDVVTEFVLAETERLFTSKSGLTPEVIRDLNSLLSLCSLLDVHGSPRLVGALKRGMNDYKLSLNTRRRCLYAFVAVVDLRVAVNTLRELLITAPVRLGYAVIAAASSFLDRCRRRLAYIASLYPDLPDLQEAIISYYERAKVHAGSDAPLLTSTTRAALVDVRHMHAAYREFSERERVATQTAMFENGDPGQPVEQPPM